MQLSDSNKIQQHAQKLRLLESLRGIAALLIVAFHATELFRLKFGQPFLRSFFEFGDAGVDFFFVLSGFFLAISSFKYIGHPRMAKDFLIKRCIRIYPFYWLVSIGIIPIYFLIPSFGKGYEQDMGVIFRSLLLIPQDHAPIVSAAWFLSHLIFFYLLFVSVILWPKVASKIIFTGLFLSGIFILADIGSGFWLRNHSSFVMDFIFSYYNLEFVTGYWIGCLFHQTQLRRSVSLPILLMGCLTFIFSGLLEVYVLHLSAENSGFSHYFEFMAYGLASVLIVGGASFLEKKHQISTNQGLVFLGSASFSIYLTHYPILSVFTKVIQLSGVNQLAFHTVSMLLACIITVVWGGMVHVYIEKRLGEILRTHLIYERA